MSKDDLKNWRERHGLTQEHAATLLGMTRSGYVRQERGERAVSPQTALLTALYDKHGPGGWPQCGT